MPYKMPLYANYEYPCSKHIWETLALFHALPPPSPDVHKQEEPEDGKIASIVLPFDSHRTCTCPTFLSKLQCGMGMGEFLKIFVYWPYSRF
jgi:hypothetical protein